ncbi:Similar to Calcium-binding mitochondrial carrier protein Aralar1; acc. no. Q9VA73 [Pyronema omphalodes CBS 100304]|uniref:Similar to Calcium-binding mitochondrial carrier protein Aralar1 acc. no. Q9VA73 n=1 Tax=Pyronema omphalodes (strain CBS 100304) TaxID=1076935 RepID=U4L9N5_PYROM|nr:Similar to Calcium-binding mitochondrial carrier protein Aralar1; acc. no. Q9VA73 [Pyronema omphalodes CBS 100304]
MDKVNSSKAHPGCPVSKSKASEILISECQSLLSKPDADYLIAFQRFDVEGKGEIEAAKESLLRSEYPATHSEEAKAAFDNDFVCWSTKNRHALTYEQFSQLLRAIQGENVRQVFQAAAFDPKGTGFIEVADFMRIV